MISKRNVAQMASAYEFIAATTGRLPMLTDIGRRHPIAAGIMVGWVAYHLRSDG